MYDNPLFNHHASEPASGSDLRVTGFVGWGEERTPASNEVSRNY